MFCESTLKNIFIFYSLVRFFSSFFFISLLTGQDKELTTKANIPQPFPDWKYGWTLLGNQPEIGFCTWLMPQSIWEKKEQKKALKCNVCPLQVQSAAPRSLYLK